MIILTETASTLNRRACIVATIIPYTFWAAAVGAKLAIRGLWASAALQWKIR